jgi:HK97 family phage prohead protease
VKRLNEKQWRDEKELRDAVLLKAVDTEVTESEEERVLNFKISTETPDSYNDVIKADGWDLERYKKNPVVLWAHSHYQPPVGQALSVEVEDGDLVASAKFADAETYAFADTVFRLLQGKFLRATSVGFFPREWTYDEDRGGYNFIQQELFEFSVVPVPANPDALALAVSDGIDCAPLKEWAEQTLDMWAPDESVALWIPKSQVEELYRSLTPAVETVTVSNQFDATSAVVLEETTGITPPDAVHTTTGDPSPDVVEQTTTVPVEKVTDGDGDFFIPDPEKVEEIGKLATKIEIEVVDKGDVEKLNERIDILADDNEDLRAQLDQLVAKQGADAAAEDADDLSEVIDFSIDSHEVESEIDVALLDLDVDPEELQDVIRRQMERELMNRTGKLPKEV